MAVLNQHKIIPADTKIYLSGEIFRNTQIDALIHEYFSKTEFWQPANPMNTETFNDNLHRFISLL
jgi:hypothetical protein